MKLFNVKTLKRHIAHVNEPTADTQKILSDWSSLISTRKINGIKETALSSDFKKLIVEGVLGYTSPVGNDEYTVESEQKILQGSVDLALGHFSNGKTDIIAPFELKGAKTKDLDAIMPGRNKTPVQQAWEYATNNVGSKWVLVSNYLEIRLYGFGEGTEAYERFDMVNLHEPDEYARFMLLLSADTRPRAFCSDRYGASVALGGLLENLPNNKLYLTRSDRNYGTYNATTILGNGAAYTAFFTLKPKKGRFDGIRHKLRLYVESAHHRPQPEDGQKVKVAAIINKALKGETVKYYRR